MLSRVPRQARRRDGDIAPYRYGARGNGARGRDGARGNEAVRAADGARRMARGKGAQGDGAGQRGVSGWQVSQDLRSLILRSGISLLFN